MKIICIGRNYIDHAKELNNPVPKKPMFFMKPDTALVENNAPFNYPQHSEDVHFEAEIVLKICKSGNHISEEFAHTYFQELTIGIDFTARDLQNECKSKGHPWEIAKAFDQSAPIGKFINKDSLSNQNSINFSLIINGEERQTGNSGDMIFSFSRIISYISNFITFKEGDLIFTGTPAGVGSIVIHDQLECYLEGVKLLDFSVV